MIFSYREDRCQQPSARSGAPAGIPVSTLSLLFNILECNYLSSAEGRKLNFAPFGTLIPHEHATHTTRTYPPPQRISLTEHPCLHPCVTRTTQARKRRKSAGRHSASLEAATDSSRTMPGGAISGREAPLRARTLRLGLSSKDAEVCVHSPSPAKKQESQRSTLRQ